MVQLCNGAGSVAVGKLLPGMASWRSATEVNTPRRMRLRVMTEKKFSTALIQEAEVGVKWKTQRG